MLRRHKWRAAFLVLFLMGLAAFGWLLRWNGAGEPQPRPVSMVQLRALAAASPGPVPVELAAERVAYRRLPQDLLAAGTGLEPRILAVWAFRITMADGSTILIDTGMTGAQTSTMGLDGFDSEGAGRISRALRAARLIIPTHEHVDHLGGLAALLRSDRAAGEAALARTLLNRGQLPDQPLSAQLDWPMPVSASARIADGAPQAAAPGVVVIPAPGHTPGSQMIYLRTADGREWLFTGDTASFDANWKELRGRSMLMQMIAPEDRAAVFGWLATIRTLKAQAPGLIVIPGHDYSALFDSSRQPLMPLTFE